MPPPLNPDQLKYRRQYPGHGAQMAHDVISFLMLGGGAEPRGAAPHGFKVILFLLVDDRRLLRRETQDLVAHRTIIAITHRIADRSARRNPSPTLRSAA